jgi:GTP-binding protein EngB required for normal cell division
MAEEHILTLVRALHSKKEIIANQLSSSRAQQLYISNKLPKRFSILICGPPRVGKSTLINAICNANVAPQSSSLDSCTKSVQAYDYNVSHPTIGCYTIRFFDTPGFENWSESKFRSTFNKFLAQTDPICVIFCASPGAYANLNELTWLVDMCRKQSIFIALVCTNMFGGSNRQSVINDYSNVLKQFGQITHHSNDLHCWNDFALTIMVNSIPYVDKDLGIHRGQQGIDELILGIMTSLRDEKMIAWCMSIVRNRSFWTRQDHRIRSIVNKFKKFWHK